MSTVAVTEPEGVDLEIVEMFAECFGVGHLANHFSSLRRRREEEEMRMFRRKKEEEIKMAKIRCFI